jgi:hypothetical protein
MFEQPRQPGRRRSSVLSTVFSEGRNIIDRAMGTNA